ncbi:hypothetical protein BD410DRAFT_837394 [Rickenella mellea]|uniref:Nicotinamide N-methyltransferase n=1 Tax=Rickenella mellea TaxID=50990 RepID=A0A4Y7QC53_9AGAM|nr:hypothetical protein BD410DRAFT_837394 [Rickenella mellea]
MDHQDSDPPEDIFSDSLVILGEDIGPQNSSVHYGELTLSIAPKEGKALNLLADQLFSPALLLAERIERGLIPLGGKSLIELGAGCALPSLLASTRIPTPSLVVLTDYPDEIILGNLRANMEANKHLVASGCTVLCRGYEWGADMSTLLELLPSPTTRGGYDVVILSDLLHFHDSHPVLVASLTSLLARNPSSRAYIAAGTYTAPHVCADFLRKAEEAGILCEEGPMDDMWRGEAPVRGVSVEQLGVRKGMCRWWTGRWRPDMSVSSAADKRPGGTW